ncbi:hypothetical protein EV197_1475 [Aquimarina brevivitae]|uniref:Uncharacterized protein n=2 Tax=Aquimarina brevivitae TaxID=323412 RepID=A0A4Q7PJK7_9FLAO|nr:hypothetical protein EV197_1475 [Aquimarina brevivitae]
MSSDEKAVLLLKSNYNQWLYTTYGYRKWAPTKKDIDRAHHILSTAIKNDEFNFLKTPSLQDLKGYYRQYIPYINAKGEKVIKINAFCELLEVPPASTSESKVWTKMDWKNRYVDVDDGGYCYWRVVINLDRNTYYNLIIG